MQELLKSVKTLMLELALENCGADNGARRAEIQTQQDLSVFDPKHPDIGMAKELLAQLGLGLIVRVPASSGDVHHLFSEGETCAVIEFVNDNHCQYPELISWARAVEVNARDPAKKLVFGTR